MYLTDFVRLLWMFKSSDRAHEEGTVVPPGFSEKLSAKLLFLTVWPYLTPIHYTNEVVEYSKPNSCKISISWWCIRATKWIITIPPVCSWDAKRGSMVPSLLVNFALRAPIILAIPEWIYFAWQEKSRLMTHSVAKADSAPHTRSTSLCEELPLKLSLQ